MRFASRLILDAKGLEKLEYKGLTGREAETRLCKEGSVSDTENLQLSASLINACHAAAIDALSLEEQI